MTSSRPTRHSRWTPRTNLARRAAELGDYADSLDQVRTRSDKAERGTRKPGDYVMVARKTRTAGHQDGGALHQVLQCHSAHRYTIRHLVTNKETVEHASYIEYVLRRRDRGHVLGEIAGSEGARAVVCLREVQGSGLSSGRPVMA
jgi:hypothetical protein